MHAPFNRLRTADRLGSMLWVATRHAETVQSAKQAAAVDYQRDAKPPLSNKYAFCHAGLKQESDLQLDLRLPVTGVTGEIKVVQAAILYQQLERRSDCRFMRLFAFSQDSRPRRRLSPGCNPGMCLRN